MNISIQRESATKWIVPCVAFLLTVLLVPQILLAELTVSSIFTDHAVLQRDMKVPIWGNAEAGATVKVAFAQQKQTATADSDGKWNVSLEPLEASFEPENLVISSGEQRIELTNILVGEVWICSGQSNMKMETHRVPEARPLARKAKHIRSFEVKRTVAFEEQDSVGGAWQQKIPNSAVAFSFAYSLQQKADVPVGIILSCWGSSSLEAWMPRDMVQTTPHFKEIMDQFDADTETRNRIQSILDGEKPWKTPDDIFLRRQSNIVYNAMMHGLAPYACRGLVWYQGERNTQSITSGVKKPWYASHSGILKYGSTLKQWVERYRKQWQNDKMHFLVVMLPGYGKILPSQKRKPKKDPDAPDAPKLGPENPDVHSWAWMRESQLQVLDLPHTAVANTIDLGDVKNIHPTDKLPIGQRLALLAARDTLGQDVKAEGPVMSRVETKGNQLIVDFKHAQGLKTLDGNTPTGFWVCDDSRKWAKAEAVIEGQAVVLTCEEVEMPLYVRYAFAGKPQVNLVNDANLPARPFRSDSFEP